MGTKALLLLSGGIDSMACLHFLQQRGYEVTALYVDYGQPSAPSEHKAAVEIARYYSVPLSVSHWRQSTRIIDGEILGRNTFLISGALMQADCNIFALVCGIHSGTSYYDCSNMFAERMNHLVQEYSQGKISLLAPFLNWSKQEIFEYVLAEKLPVHLTYSCEKGVETGCGNCLSCKDREYLYAPR